MPDQNGIPVVARVQDGSGTGYMLRDPYGEPIILQTTSGISWLCLAEAIGKPDRDVHQL